MGRVPARPGRPALSICCRASSRPTRPTVSSLGVEQADVIVVGGGIIGLASAHAILSSGFHPKVVVLEKEDRPGAHQSGRNSGVIHSGVYYRPGSLKAKTVAAGRRALLELCRANGVAHEIVGKVIVAVDERERPALRELALRARQNRVPAALLTPKRLAELEPHAFGIEALHVPGAGIVDFKQVCETLVRLVEARGGHFFPRRKVLGLTERDNGVIVETDQSEIQARVVVNCAGLHSDRLVARRNHREGTTLRIVPFRGEYRRLTSQAASLVQTMIYPVPDPRFPFLGAHFTRAVGNEVHAGPNAVLAFAREGYSWVTIDVRDTWELLRFPGFRRLVRRHWRTGLSEMLQSLSDFRFVKVLQRLVPAIRAEDLLPAPAGVRAQAVDARGTLIDDFVLDESRRIVHVLNAPSPAATASLEIGRLVAERALERI